MPLQLAICDDEPTQIAYLSQAVTVWARRNEISIQVQSYPSAEAFLFAYAENKGVDILLLDIQMKGMDGISLARELRQDNDSLQIVFITGYADYMAQGYDVAALHYLLKPVDAAKLESVLDRACKALSHTERTLLLNTGGENVRLPVEQIQYVEVFAHTVSFRLTTGAPVEARLTIAETESLLGNGFVRCHRSYVVGLKHIRRITKSDVVLDSGQAIPLSRRLYHDVNQAFIAYFKG